MSTALLQIEGLSIPIPGDGDRAFAVQNIDLTLHAGEILCVVGESGSGKSMSANAVMGLLPAYMQPSAGRILFQGRDLLALPEAELRRLRGSAIGMIFQEPLSALNPVMRVGAQIAEVLEVHGVTDAGEVDRRVRELIDFVGLPDPGRIRHSYPFRLSGGQRQRVMIAMALALEPAILIADEPTTALDVTTQAQILALIQSIQRRKGTGGDGRSTGMGVMFITHDFGVVAEIADRVAVMEKGVLVEVGTAEQVLNAPQHPYTWRLIAAVPRRRTEVRDAVAHSAPVLDVRNLKKTYATGGGWFGARRVVHAVDDVSFTVRRGETLGIVGESGSGKSTIGKCLLKLVDVDGGQMLFNGRDIAALSAHAFRPLRKDIQMIFQDPFASLNPRQTVGRIVSDGPVASGKTRAEAEARARELLALVGLEASSFDRYPNEFSGGQRQRVGIARALALDPQVLVADESVSALDVSVQAQVLALLHDLQQKLQIALVFITHDLRVAAQVCDTVLVMHRGRIVERGSPQQIFDRPQDAYTQRLIAAVPGQQWNPTQAHDAIPFPRPPERPHASKDHDMTALSIDGDRLWASLMELAQIGGTPAGGVARLALTELDRQGRERVIGWAQEAGCTIRVDQIGNIFARRPGRENDAPSVASGSHIDTQPTGGKFDGNYGVLAVLEVFRTLNDHDIQTRLPLEMAIWTNEEGSRFVPVMMGSGVYAGAFTLESALAAVDREGISVESALKAIGYAGDTPAAVSDGAPLFAAYFEAHIEQGPVLEDADIVIGAVTGALGQRWYDITVTGQEAHAGPTPMALRRDALQAATQLMQETVAIALRHAPHGRGTVGTVDVFPSSRNVIPGRVKFTADLRNIDDETLSKMDAELRAACAEVAVATKTKVDIEQVVYFPPTAFAPALVDGVRQGAQKRGYSCTDVVSGAGHDAVYVASQLPVAMIFVPCKDGISHNEIEDAKPEHLTAGCNVLLDAMLLAAS